MPVSRSDVAAKWVESGPQMRPGSTRGTDDEAGLLAKVAAGEQAAFRILVDRHLAALLAIARRMLGDEAESEDVVQEALVRLWRSAPRLELGPGGLRPWLRRVVSNLAIDRVRQGRRVTVTDEVPEVAVEADQSAELEQRDAGARVDAALQQLPDRQRLAITLFHFEGLSQIEVGRAMGITDEAVESLLARARRSLRTELQNEWRELLPETNE